MPLTMRACGSRRRGPRHRLPRDRETGSTDRRAAAAGRSRAHARRRTPRRTLRKSVADAVAIGVFSAARQSGSHSARMTAAGCPSSNVPTVSAGSQWKRSRRRLRTKAIVARRSAQDQPAREGARTARCSGAGSGGVDSRNTPGSIRHRRPTIEQILLGTGAVHGAHAARAFERTRRAGCAAPLSTRRAVGLDATRASAEACARIRTP